MRNKNVIRLIALVPVWVGLSLSAFATENIPSVKTALKACDTVEYYNPKTKETEYTFTCSVDPGDGSYTETPIEPEPSDSPSATPSEVSPSVSDEPTPTSLPTESAPLPTPDVTDLTPIPAPFERDDGSIIANPVVLENGVVLEKEVADALVVLDNPIDFVNATFTDPKKVFKAVANIGADMRPEVRDDAQKVLVSAIIVVQVIGGTVTTLLRKP